MRHNSIVSAAISILVIIGIAGCAVDLTADRTAGNFHIELKSRPTTAENGGDANGHTT